VLCCHAGALPSFRHVVVLGYHSEFSAVFPEILPTLDIIESSYEQFLKRTYGMVLQQLSTVVYPSAHGSFRLLVQGLLPIQSLTHLCMSWLMYHSPLGGTVVAVVIVVAASVVDVVDSTWPFDGCVVGLQDGNFIGAVLVGSIDRVLVET